MLQIGFGGNNWLSNFKTMYQTAHRKNHRKALSRTLAILRKRQEVRREYLANKLGLSLSSMDKLEQGVTYLRFTDVYILCKALGVEIKDLIVLYEMELEKVSSPCESDK